MDKTRLLTPQDEIIKSRIADRQKNNRIRWTKEKKENIKKYDEFINGLIRQFGSFKKFIEKVDFDIELGLVYDRDNKTKTCSICGEVMPIHAMLSVHRKRCGVYKIYEKGKVSTKNIKQHLQTKANES